MLSLLAAPPLLFGLAGGVLAATGVLDGWRSIVAAVIALLVTALAIALSIVGQRRRVARGQTAAFRPLLGTNPRARLLLGGAMVLAFGLQVGLQLDPSEAAWPAVAPWQAITQAWLMLWGVAIATGGLIDLRDSRRRAPR